jgi:hypothetical protein
MSLVRKNMDVNEQLQFMSYRQTCSKSNTTGVASGACSDYSSWASVYRNSPFFFPDRDFHYMKLEWRQVIAKGKQLKIALYIYIIWYVFVSIMGCIYYYASNLNSLTEAPTDTIVESAWYI